MQENREIEGMIKKEIDSFPRDLEDRKTTTNAYRQQSIVKKIVDENKLKIIGWPNVTITKIAKNNPLGFKLKTAIAPEMKLPDYKEIAKNNKNSIYQKIHGC